MKFVVLGDAHLWPVLWMRLPAARNDAFYAADQVLMYAVNRQLPVISSGDIMDCGDKGGVSKVLSWLKLHSQLDVGYIVGNHDLSGYTVGVQNPPWANILENFKRIDRDEEWKKGVQGLDYQHGRTQFIYALNVLREKGRRDILVIHQAIKELLPFEGAWQVTLDELQGLAKLVICGDVHISKEFTLPDGTIVLSPGSTVATAFNEELDKKFPVVEIDGKMVKVEWVPIVQRRAIYEATAINAEERKEVLKFMETEPIDSKLPEDIRSPILQIKFTPDKDFYNKMQKIAEERGFILDEHSLPDMSRIDLSKLVKTASTDEIVAATEKHTSPGKVRDAAIEIQRTRDPAGVIDKYLTIIEKGLAC